jgi:excisionase family DNA binding protein
MENGERLIDIVELGRRTNVKVATLRKMVYQNRVPYVRIGRLIRFRPSQIDIWLDSLGNGPKLETRRNGNGQTKSLFGD